MASYARLLRHRGRFTLVLAVSGLLVVAGLGRAASVAADREQEAPGILTPAVATAEALCR
jgi:hypothetical protein